MTRLYGQAGQIDHQRLGASRITNQALGIY
jgi:hypothetical protein